MTVVHSHDRPGHEGCGLGGEQKQGRVEIGELSQAPLRDAADQRLAASPAKTSVFSGVSIQPGHSALTRMPCRAHSSASALVSCTTAAYDAV